MIGLQVNGKWVDLREKEQVTITLHNPIFDAENIERVFSYPFKLPTSPNNLDVYNFANRLDVSDDTEDFEAKLFLQEQFFDQGFTQVGQCTPNQIGVHFKNQELDFLEQLDEININEILETVEIPKIFTAELRYEFDPDSIIYSVSVDDKSYVQESEFGTPTNVQLIINQINEDFPGLVRREQPHFMVFDSTQNRRIVADFGFTSISHRTVPIARQDNFEAYFIDLKNNPDLRFAFPTLYNPNFYDGKNPLFEGYINFYNNGNTLPNQPHLDSLEDRWQHTYVPFVRLTYVLDKILETTGYTAIISDFYDSTDIQSLLLYNNYALDKVEPMYSTTGEAQRLNGFKESINLNEHVPDITAKELFLNFLELFNLYPRIKGTQIHLYKKIDQLKLPPIDWTDKAEPNYQFTKNQARGFTLDYEDDEKDEVEIAGQLEPFISGDGENEIYTRFNTLHDLNTFSTIGGTEIYFWKLPYILQKGSSDELGIEQNEPGLRLFFDRGIQQDSAGNDYHLATYSNTNYADAQVGELSLTWQGEKGLYNQLWKGFPELQDGQPFTKVMRLDVVDLLDTRKWLNSLRKIYHDQGECVLVIKSIQIKASTTLLSLAKVEGIQIKSRP